MSFGALSKEAKIALAQAATKTGIATSSGEGGILPEERAAADNYIFEYVPNLYSVTEENLQTAQAIEIKIGQATKPGLGGHLPGTKVTPEIAKLRGKKEGEDIHSPCRFPGINTGQDLRQLVTKLRQQSKGRPIGVKIAAGHLEDDLEFILPAAPDFITIDGRGGATGASPLLIRDSTSLPTIYALARARRFLQQKGAEIDLIITGGLRVASDITKALTLGADAVALGTAALIALGCQQYRQCHLGQCPLGIATQDPKLRSRLHPEIAAARVVNVLQATHTELQQFARLTGHPNLHDLTPTDLTTPNPNLARALNLTPAAGNFN
jgi:glutamate synthase domain-containing protein 2